MSAIRLGRLLLAAAFSTVLGACGGGGDSAVNNTPSGEQAVRTAPSTLWQPPAGATPTSGNYVYLQSDTGDYVGGGGSSLYTQADAAITVSSNGTGAAVQAQGGQSWAGNFQLPAVLSTLKAAYFDSVQSWPSQDTTAAALSFAVNGRSCSGVTGWLAIDRVLYTGSVVASIELRFEQRCSGSTAALRGKVRWAAADPTAPLPPGEWQAPASAIPSSGNYVYLQGETGDYIVGNNTHLYTGSNAVLSTTTENGRVEINVEGFENWRGAFQAMAPLTQLQVGLYSDLTRFPFHNPTRGGLDWSGDGRGCNTLTGWFAVDEVTYVNGQLDSIQLRFEQHCEARTPALRGQLRWSASDTTRPSGPVQPPPADLWQPPVGATPATGNYVYLRSDTGDYIGQGATGLLTAPTVSFSTSSQGAAQFSLTVTTSSTSSWRGDFKAMNVLTQLEPGYYPNVRRYPFHNPAFGGLDWSGMGRGCNELTGWFAIDSVTYTAGNVTAIELRFEQHCEGRAPALRGKLRWSTGG
jgi:hypothetical protein